MNKTCKTLLLALPLLLAACGNEEVTPQGGGTHDSNNTNANLAGSDASVTRLEVPHLNSQHDYICHRLTNGDVNYSLEYDKSNYHARWVAYTYDTQNAKRNWTTRTDAWAAEPFYAKQPQYQIASHLSSGRTQTFQGYNRGHLVGSAERYYSEEANMQTFYMSNMSPMNGQFNSTYWGSVEDVARDNWGRGVTNSRSTFYNGTLYIVKGGTLDKGRVLSPIRLQNGRGDYVYMAVPKYYFIACLFVDAKGNAKAIGFWMEHKDYKNTSDSFLAQLRRESACSIDELEQKTGIDFFCNLADNAERHVEAQYDMSQWPGL